MMYSVTVNKTRPDFRVFIDLLFGAERNVDTDGDAEPVWSREWRELYLKDREADVPRVEIYAPESDPSRFQVNSENPRLCEIATLYLYLHCGELIECNGETLTQAQIKALQAKYAFELSRAERAVWHQSTEDNPYPKKVEPISVEDSREKYVWIFNGGKARFPSAVFADRNSAEHWIATHKLKGLLTKYPVGESVYDWVIRNDYFHPKSEGEKESDFIGNFSSGYMEHHHYDGDT